MGEAIHITEYLAFIDTLSKESPIEERLQAAEKWMEERNAGTIFFPDDYLEANKWELSFDSMVFAGHLKFESPSFLESFKFQNCRVTGVVSFDALYNVNLIEIKSTEIGGDLTIHTNLESLIIANSKVSGSIELEKDSAIDTLAISNCEAEKISMRGVTISETTLFRHTIPASLDATGAKFGGPVSCRGVHFIGEANFTNAEFSKLVEFSEVTFHHIAEFYNTKFSSATLFSKTTFCHEVNFGLSTFSSFVNFQRATFADLAGFFRVIFHYPAVFSHATFRKKGSWVATEFKKNVAFDKVTFCYPPNFRSAIFHVTPDLHALEITKPYELPDDSDENIQIVPIYRRLKKLAAEANNHRGFLDHGAREVRAKCLGAVKGNALIPALYFALSNHGRSIILPFIWLIAAILFGGLFYAATDAHENVLLLVASFIPILGFPLWAVHKYCDSKCSDGTLEIGAIFWAGASIVIFLIARLLFEFEIRVTALHFILLGAVLYLGGILFRSHFPVLEKRYISLWRTFVWILALASSVGLGFALVYAVQFAQATEGSRALATSVMASLSITQLFRLFPGGIHEVVSCGMMALTPENMELCLTMERGEFLALEGNENIRFIPGAYIASGVQVLTSSGLLFLLGLGIRNRIKTG